MIWSVRNATQIPTCFYKIVPYVVTLVVLAFTFRSSREPRSSGLPYKKGGK
ncbi:hypothetical protein AALA90_17610 [Lachnospiraceae bacterium 38-10]